MSNATSRASLFRLACLLQLLGACRVDGYYFSPDAGQPEDAEAPAQGWVARFGGVEDEYGRAIAAAPNGDIVLAGEFRGITVLGGAPMVSAGQSDIWVARYRPDGSHVWSIRMGGSNYDLIFSVAVDSVGDVYVVGQNWGRVDFGGGERPYRGGFLVKLFGANGAYIWDRTVSGPDQVLGANRATGVSAIDPNRVVVCGRFGGTVDFGGGNRTSTPLSGTDWFLAAYESSTGGHLWSRPLTSSGHEQVEDFDGDRCEVIAVDGDVIAAGLFRGTATLGGASLNAVGDSDVFVASFRGTDGVHLWSKRYGGTGSDSAYELATDGARVFVGGVFEGTANFGGADLIAASRDAFVAAYHKADGGHIWSQRLSFASLAASPTQLAAITPGSTITRLDPENGAPSQALHLGGPVPQVHICYVGGQLAGQGTFNQMTTLFGTTLTSLGGYDVAAFRVAL